MARPMKPLVRGGGYYPSNGWTPLVYPGGYTTANGGEEPAPPPIEKTITGNPIHILDALAKPAQSLSVKLKPIQDLHGQASPYPAGGGKNKLPYPYYGTFGTINGVEFTDLGDGRLKINGTATARAVFLLENHNSVIQSGEYIVSRGTDVFGPRITVDAYNGNKWVKVLATIAGDEQTITIDYDGYDRIDVFVSVIANTTVSNVIVAPMFRLSSVTDATFAPYSNICPIGGWTGANIHVSPTTDAADGETYSITFPTEAGTVYGGTLDVTAGKMVVDRAMVDLGTLNYGLNSHATLGQYFWCDVYSRNIKRAGEYSSTVYPSICSAFKCVPRNAREFVNSTYCFDGSADRVTQIQFKDSAYSDATSFKTAVSGVQLVYELATPQTIQLTPQQVELLLGENNIWSDGEMTLVYLADGNASDAEALGILLGGRYTPSDDVTDKEALDIILGGTK